MLQMFLKFVDKGQQASVTIKLIKIKDRNNNLDIL